MDKTHHAYTLADNDALTLAALDAANHSYAPYSQAVSGVALQTAGGDIYTGRYAENAAFNPSLPPLQAALNLLNLAGEKPAQIVRAVIVERRNAAVRQGEIASIILRELGCKDVVVRLIEA